MNQFLPVGVDTSGSDGEDGSCSAYIRSLPAVVRDVGKRAIKIEMLDDGSPCTFVHTSNRDSAVQTTEQTIHARRPAVGGGEHDAVPGETVRIQPRRVRSFGKIRCIIGELADRSLDVEALGLVPLRLFDRGEWGPLVRNDDGAETGAHASGANGDAVGRAADSVADRVMRRDLLLELVQGTGPRPAYEMERVRNKAGDAGDADAAEKLDVYDERDAADERDLRCLDWHARLGQAAFQGNTKKALARAIRHYRVGVAIGDVTVGEEFDGVLSWSHAGNRPFLRCLHGLGLCWWRLGEPERASEVFRRLLWLDPEDPLDARPLLKQLDLGFMWEQSYTAQIGPVLVESLAGR